MHAPEKQGALRMLNLAKGKPRKRNWSALFINQLKGFGEFVQIEDVKAWGDQRLAEYCRDFDVILTDWSAPALPEILAENPGRLRYVCNLTGSIRHCVPRRFVELGIPVTNWGDTPAVPVAEAALTLLLSSLKLMVPQSLHVRGGGWGDLDASWRGSVQGLRIGVYGMGVIGRRFIDLVRPLEPRLYGFDPFITDWPAGIEQVEQLTALCEQVDVLVIAAGLSDETRKSLKASHLALLPDGGIVINVARGAIIDQEALFAELSKGRLRAGLDVLDTDGSDYLPPDHPARSWPNLLLTAHRLASSEWNTSLHSADALSASQRVCLENLERFVAGKPLQYTFDESRYDRST